MSMRERIQVNTNSNNSLSLFLSLSQRRNIKKKLWRRWWRRWKMKENYYVRIHNDPYIHTSLPLMNSGRCIREATSVFRRKNKKFARVVGVHGKARHFLIYNFSLLNLQYVIFKNWKRSNISDFIVINPEVRWIDLLSHLFFLISLCSPFFLLFYFVVLYIFI